MVGLADYCGAFTIGASGKHRHELACWFPCGGNAFEKVNATSKSTRYAYGTLQSVSGGAWEIDVEGLGDGDRKKDLGGRGTIR